MVSTPFHLPLKEIEVEVEPSPPKINLYPNPFIDRLEVEVQIDQEDVYLFQIYQSNGQLLFAESRSLVIGKQNLALNLNREWPAANYIFVISQNDHNLFTRQIVKIDNQ